MSNLEANLRSVTSKGSNNILRKQGMVPAVLYGGEEKNELIKFQKSVWFKLKLGSRQKIEKQHLLYKHFLFLI